MKMNGFIKIHLHVFLHWIKELFDPCCGTIRINLVDFIHMHWQPLHCKIVLFVNTFEVGRTLLRSFSTTAHNSHRGSTIYRKVLSLRRVGWMLIKGCLGSTIAYCRCQMLVAMALRWVIYILWNMYRSVLSSDGKMAGMNVGIYFTLEGSYIMLTISC